MTNETTTIAAETQKCFEMLRDDWKQKSQFMSNTAQMAMLWPYQQIIGMGEAVLPLLLQELQREPDHWFWALEAISRENPVSKEDAAHVKTMTNVWLDWGRNNGLLDEHEVKVPSTRTH